MKSRLYPLIKWLNIFLLIVFFIACEGADRFAYAEMIDGIVAVVDDTLIMMSDFRAKVDSAGLNPVESNQAGKVLEIMIEDIIVEKSYQEFGLPPIDPENVRSVMADTGLEFEDALCLIKRQSLIGVMVKSRVVVTPHMIADYYNAHPKYCGRQSVRLKQILIKKDRQKAKAVMADINEGNTFDDVAGRYSDVLISGSCDIGWIAISDLAPKIKEAMSDAKAGSIIGPVETENGIFIFELSDRGVRDKNAFDEVKDEIRHILEGLSQQDAFRYWLSKTKREHFIGIYLSE